jgi:coatomer subunit beta'
MTEDKDLIKIYKNLSEFKAFHTGFPVEGIHGGRLLAVKSKEFVTFYDWETQILVRRIDVSPAPKSVYWSDNGQQVVLALDENYYLLNFNSNATEAYIQ